MAFSCMLLRGGASSRPQCRAVRDGTAGMAMAVPLFATKDIFI